jgi:GxxExxY protein
MISVADFPDVPQTRDPLTDTVLRLAIEVHRTLGPGLLESAYCACLAREMELARVSFQRELEVPLNYKGVLIPMAYRLDFLIEDQLVLEIKSIDRFEAVHEAQLLTYLRLTGRRTGLLLNFNEKLLKNGIVRRVL